MIQCFGSVDDEFQAGSYIRLAWDGNRTPPGVELPEALFGIPLHICADGRISNLDMAVVRHQGLLFSASCSASSA
jgi:hypothetical protein